MNSRLSRATIAKLPGTIAIPRYDRDAVTPGIVHLGVGAFHRAHQAAYVDACLTDGEADWGIVGVSLRSPSQCSAATISQPTVLRCTGCWSSLRSCATPMAAQAISR